MGVMSNKINIMELMKGGGGDPTIPGRVSALETETAGLIEANAKIMTSVSDCIEAIQHVQTSVAALDLETAGLIEANARIMTSVRNMNAEITNIKRSKVTVETDGTKTYGDLINELKSKIAAVYDNMSNGQTLYIEQLIPDVGTFALDYIIKPTTKDVGVSLPNAFAFTCIFDYNVINGYFVLSTSNSVSYTQQMWNSSNHDFTITQKKSEVPIAGKTLEVTYHIE